MCVCVGGGGGWEDEGKLISLSYQTFQEGFDKLKIPPENW